MPWLALSLAVFTGCQNEKSPSNVDEHNQFVSDTSVRIIQPQNGSIVEDSFYLQYEAGQDIAHLEFWLDGAFSTTLEKSATETLVHLSEGPHTLTLKSLNSNTDLLQEHSITVTVPSDFWIAITSPTDVLPSQILYNLP